MPAPIFAEQGTSKDDFITVDGEVDWAVLPAYTIKGQKVDLPIRLRVGDQNFGEEHIYVGHKDWLDGLKRTARELIWEKLSLQGGKFYKGKPGNKGQARTNLFVKLSPDCLLVMEKQQDKTTTPPTQFLSVVTLYKKQPTRYDKSIGDYSSNFKNPKANRALRKG